MRGTALVPASLQAQNAQVSLCACGPVVMMPPKLKMLVDKGKDQIPSLGILGRALKNCQLMEYKSQDPIFSSQYLIAS